MYSTEIYENRGVCRALSNGSRYSKIDQLKFVEDNLQKYEANHITSNFLKAVFQRYYSVHS